MGGMWREKSYKASELTHYFTSHWYDIYVEQLRYSLEDQVFFLIFTAQNVLCPVNVTH